VLLFFKKHIFFIIYGIALLLFRFMGLLAQKQTSGFIYAPQGGFKSKVILHMLLYPLTSLGQILIPPLDFFQFAGSFAKHQYAYLLNSPLAGLLVQSAVLDMLSIVLSLGLITLLLRSAVLVQEKKLLYFSLSWATISFLPYAVLERSYSYLESRYYYGGVPGLGISLAIVAHRFWRTRKLWIRGFVALSIAFYLGIHIRLIHRDIAAQVLLSSERKALISELVKIKPFLQDKNMIYITGSRSYVLPEMPLPFQQGVGYTLMVLYADTGKIPRKFLEGQYLWNINDDGYQEEWGYGFGYYFNEERLRESLKRYNLGPKNVFSFYYNGNEKKLTNTTEHTRNLL